MISIIIPFHKGRLFLRDCFESIVDQHMDDIETLFVLDHPEEDVSDICAEFKDQIHLREFELTDKTGVSVARNMGLDHAKGDYVYFLDPDDYFMKDTLGQLVRTLNEKPYDIVYGKVEDSWYKRDSYMEEYYTGEEKFVTCVEAAVEQREELNRALDATAYDYLFGKRTHLISVTTLHILIKKSMLDEHQIRFIDELELYADAPFICRLLAFVQDYKVVKNSVYAKRMHNDEMNYPSLDKVVRSNRFNQYALAYKECLKQSEGEELLCNGIKLSLCRFYSNGVIKRIRRNPDVSWRNDNYKLLHELIQDVDPSVYKELPRGNRKHLKLLRKGDLAASMKYINKDLAKKKIQRMLTNKAAFNHALLEHIYRKMPLKQNCIMFESFLGRNYSDSPKYIYLYMQEKYGDQFTYIWAFDKSKKTKSDIKGKHKTVKRYTWRYYYYMTRCKYWVHNMRQPVWWNKRKGQVFLETWHGTPLKKLVFDMEDLHFSNKDYKRITYSQSRKWDYLISANPFSTKVFQSAFMYPEDKIIEVGYPRNDIMYSPKKDEIAAALKEKFNIPADKKTVLYAPTWRDDEYDLEGQVFDLKLDLKKMKQELGDEYVVLLRTHYHIAEKMDISGMGLDDFAFNFCKYDDISELYLISDICITDYSSVFFDYANLKRPMLFYTYDLDKYRDVLRGFYLDIETTVPGPLLFNTDEVIDAIKNIDQVKDEYHDKYVEFYNRFCGVDDGEASKRAVDIMLGKNAPKDTE